MRKRLRCYCSRPRSITYKNGYWIHEDNGDPCRSLNIIGFEPVKIDYKNLTEIDLIWVDEEVFLKYLEELRNRFSNMLYSNYDITKLEKFLEDVKSVIVYAPRAIRAIRFREDSSLFNQIDLTLNRIVLELFSTYLQHDLVNFISNYELENIISRKLQGDLLKRVFEKILRGESFSSIGEYYWRFRAFILFSLLLLKLRFISDEIRDIERIELFTREQKSKSFLTLKLISLLRRFIRQSDKIRVFLRKFNIKLEQFIEKIEITDNLCVLLRKIFLSSIASEMYEKYAYYVSSFDGLMIFDMAHDLDPVIFTKNLETSKIKDAGDMLQVLAGIQVLRGQSRFFGNNYGGDIILSGSANWVIIINKDEFSFIFYVKKSNNKLGILNRNARIIVKKVIEPFKNLLSALEDAGCNFS